MYQTILLDIQPPFAYITLNRPEVRNAMNSQMVEDLLAAFTALKDNHAVRAIMLAGAGETFCAGGDVNELKAASTSAYANGNTRLDDLLQAINAQPQVVVAKIQGAAMGGGLGLVCVSDIALTAADALFALPEVRLGIVPALISPYVVQRVGLTRARLLLLTGARFDGVSAHEYGLVHEVCPSEILDECVDAVLNDLRQCSPNAIAAGKRLLTEVAANSATETLHYRAKLLDELRRSDEGQEGLKAFLEKRKPYWSLDNVSSNGSSDSSA